MRGPQDGRKSKNDAIMGRAVGLMSMSDDLAQFVARFASVVWRGGVAEVKVSF
jgi:hypothetical protein